MTIKDKQVIQKIIDNDGDLEGSTVSSVWQYLSETEERLYAVFMDWRHCDIYNSPYVKNPVLLWSEDEGKIQNPS